MYSVQSLIQDPILLRLIFALIIVLITVFARHLLSHVVIKRLYQIKIQKISLDFSRFDCLQKPINYLLLITGIYFALKVSPFVYYQNTSEQILELNNFQLSLSLIHVKFLNRIYTSLFAGISTWVIYNLEHLYEQFFMDLNERHALIDNTVIIRYLARMIRFISIAIGVIITLIILIPDLSTVITGVGIGGAAVAFVSKDSLASVFSGMSLLLDKPFVIGDWITVNDTDGIVEDISFRSTRIRTFSQSVVVIPNHTINNANITNWSRMEKRRVSFELGVTYQTTPTQMKQCVKALKEMISTQADIEPSTVLVHFTDFGDYSLNIKIIYYTLKTDFASYLAIQEHVNLEILNICKQHHIQIAFPTQTIEMHS